jgi:hypothetical protein
MKEETPRNYWKMGRIVNAIQSEDGKVRKAEVAVSYDGTIKRYLRPLKEFVVLIRAEEQ